MCLILLVSDSRKTFLSYHIALLLFEFHLGLHNVDLARERRLEVDQELLVALLGRECLIRDLEGAGVMSMTIDTFSFKMSAAMANLISCFIRGLCDAYGDAPNSCSEKLLLILGPGGTYGELGHRAHCAQGHLTLVKAGGGEEELSALTRLSRVCTLQVGLL